MEQLLLSLPPLRFPGASSQTMEDRSVPLSREEPSGATPPTKQQTSTGLSPNAAGTLAYVLGALTGILFLVLEKENRFVRFHAAQSIGVTVLVFIGSIVLMIVGTILGVIPIVGWLVGLMLSLVFSVSAFALWLFLMFQAWQGRKWEVPFVGARVREMLASGTHVS